MKIVTVEFGGTDLEDLRALEDALPHVSRSDIIRTAVYALAGKTSSELRSIFGVRSIYVP